MRKKHIGWLLFGLTAAIAAAYFVSSYYAKPKVPVESGRIDVCFTQQEDCAGKLEALILQSQNVRAALYDLDQANITSALKKKAADVLIDEDNYAGYGKKISTPGLMHDKFFILKNANGTDILVTGSANPTRNDFEKNDNNLVFVESPTLIKNYEAEFEEIKQHGPQKKTANTEITLNSFSIENYFCPEDDCEHQVLAELNSARSSIDLMVFSFTSDPLGKMIVENRQAYNLAVRGIFDKSQVAANKEYSEYFRLNKSGVPVKIKSGSGKLHHKVFIIDKDTVILGSYNPTASGNSKNEENVLIIHNSDVAGKFSAEFERIWGAN